MKCSNLPGALSPFTIAAVNPWSLTLLSLAILIPVCLALFFVREKRLWRLGVFLGVTMAISNQATIDECIQETQIPNLWVLTSGPLPPNPAEILQSLRDRQSIKGEIVLAIELAR